MDKDSKWTVDFQTVGRRVRERRQRLGMSTQELAERAGVARYTLIRMEAGFPFTKKTFAKVRSALGMFTDQITRPYEEGPFAVHRAEDSHWSVALSKSRYQRVTEGEHPFYVDDAAERRRLGELGFQPFFTAVLGSEISGGITSQALMEFHHPSWVDQHVGEEFVYCLRGEVTILVDNIPCALRAGDSMTFDANRPHQYMPTNPVQPDELPPLILLVVALRPTERIMAPKAS